MTTEMGKEIEKVLQAEREREQKLEEAEREQQRKLEEAKTMAFGKGIAFGIFFVAMVILGISAWYGWPW
ncbi:hypothetical protein ES703_18793 [subsurface metagenome]